MSTVEEVREAKLRLEADIRELVTRFEHSTGVYVTDVSYTTCRDRHLAKEVYICTDCRVEIAL